MARISGVDLPKEKRVEIGLTYIYGIGLTTSQKILAKTGINRAVVEFLRVNTWIRKWFDIDYSEYKVLQSGYWHLPLRKKKEYISKLTGFKEMTVCEDESEAYEYWKHHFNHNPEDCCNLRQK